MPGGARWIVDRGVKVVGIDYLSIEPMDSKRFDTHRVILGNRLVIVEGLDLANIYPGHYNLFLPADQDCPWRRGHLPESSWWKTFNCRPESDDG